MQENRTLHVCDGFKQIILLHRQPDTWQHFLFHVFICLLQCGLIDTDISDLREIKSPKRRNKMRKPKY